MEGRGKGNSGKRKSEKKVPGDWMDREKQRGRKGEKESEMYLERTCGQGKGYCVGNWKGRGKVKFGPGKNYTVKGRGKCTVGEKREGGKRNMKRPAGNCAESKKSEGRGTNGNYLK